MKWRILFFIFLMPITGHLGAQHLIEGKYLPEPVLKTGSDDPKYGYAIYKVEKGKDRIFTLVIGYQYDEAYPFSMPVGLARVKIDGKYGFITTTNKLNIPARYEWADNFNKKGFCRVMQDGKYGLIDEKGAFVVPNRYDTMDDLLNGWYEVSQDGVWGYVHRTNIYVSSYDEYRKKCDAGLCDSD
ncbi:MAG: WG repeat-containing protein [Candidatus Paraprevotella stercoravium]|uniref:WG repeat-containing protein n=1 Tax=Candidatus Paraprevotella stercoravium TaxID=2838725 RepID=A0A9E2L732_9BACT|nr:WG repeat-containing protein [Candidatus Paraprevotella stercoravium]